MISFDSSRPGIGYLCSYIPIELIHAAGFVPYRIYYDGSSQSVVTANNYLQRNSCPFARQCMGQLARGAYEGLKGVILSHSCDNMRSVAENHLHYGMSPEVLYTLELPRVLEIPSGRNYYLRQLNELRSALEEMRGGEISEEDLEESIRLYNSLREDLRSLHEKIVYEKDIQGIRTFYDVLHGFFTQDPTRFKSGMSQLTSNHSRFPARESPRRVLLVGSAMCGANMELIDVIHENGGLVVDDYICTGVRALEMKIPSGSWKALGESYLSVPPCPRMYPAELRKQQIENRIRESKIDVVVHYVLKFCDTFSYDAPALKEMCKKISVPFTSLETDLAEQDRGRLKTRIEAFFESTD